MFIRTNLLIVAALATLAYAAPSTDKKISPVDRIPPMDSSPVEMAGVVTCYSGTTWTGNPSSYHATSDTLGKCENISSSCASALWSISYKGTKCIKFYSKTSCSGSETYEVHANIQGSDQFQQFNDMKTSNTFSASSYKVYNC